MCKNVADFSMRSDDIHPGDVIGGKYRVRAILTRNPNLVLEAFHVEFDQRVVIKMLLPGTGDEAEIERFRREARVLSKLESEHAARVVDVGTQPDGSFFLARQHVEGEDLATYVQSYGPRPLPEAALIVLQAAECVAETHSHGIVLRELSPQNIAVARRPGGSPLTKITDFGTAKLMRDVSAPAGGGSLTATALFGISPYSSPELVRKAKSVDQRADVWSLGAVLYFALAGHPPFTGDMTKLMLAITKEEPRKLTSLRGDLPPDIDDVIGWAMAKDVDRRFKNVHAFAHALAPFASSEGRVLVERIAQIAHQAKQRKSGAPPAPVSYRPPPPSASGRPPGYSSVYPPRHPVDIGDAEELVGDEEATVVLGGSKLGQQEITDQMPGLGLSMRGLAIPPPPPSIPPSPYLPGSDRMPKLVPPAPAHRRAYPSAPDSVPAFGYARHDTGAPPASLPPAASRSVAPPPRRGFDLRILWGALAATAVMAPVVVLLLFRDAPKSASAGAGQGDAEPARGASRQARGADEPAAAGSAVVLEAPGPQPTAAPDAPPNAPARQPGGALPQPRAKLDPPKRDDPPKSDPPKEDASGGGTGRLLAIASGGSCAFSVDGASRGKSSSLSMSLPVGNHTVVCKPTSGPAKSRSVAIKKDQTAMLTFKL